MSFSVIRGFVDIDCNSLFNVIDCKSVHTRGHNHNSWRVVLLLFEKEISTFFPGCRELNLLQLCKINCCWPFSELNKDKDKDKDKEHCNINCRNINVLNRLPAHVVNSDSVTVFKLAV